MDKPATLKVYQIINDLLQTGKFPGDVAPALVMAQQHVAAVIRSLETDISAPAPKKTTRKKKVSK